MNKRNSRKWSAYPIKPQNYKTMKAQKKNAEWMVKVWNEEKKAKKAKKGADDGQRNSN